LDGAVALDVLLVQLPSTRDILLSPILVVMEKFQRLVQINPVKDMAVVKKFVVAVM
jgi:hypothetical protein